MARRRNAAEDTAPLLAEEGVLPPAKLTNLKKNRWRQGVGDEWDPNLPYGGKVYLARQLKEDPLWIKIGEVYTEIFDCCYKL